MKKKFVSYLVLAGSVLGLAMVGSCKDYEYEVLQDQIDNLGGKQTGDVTTLQGKITALQGDVAKIKADAAKLNNDQLSDSLAKVYNLLANMLGKTSIGDLSPTDMSNLNKAIANAASTAYVDDEISSAIDSLMFLWSDSLYTAYKNAEYAKNKIYAWSDSLKEAMDTAKYAKDLAEKNVARIDTLRKEVDALIAAQDSLVGRIELQDSLKNLEARYQAADAELLDSIGKVSKRVDDLVKDLKKLEDKVDKLYNAEEKRINSLYVQGAYNPIFGSFALPAGIRTKVLAAYYGEILNATKFPLTANDADNSAIVDDSMLILKAEAYAFGTIKKVNQESIKAGSITGDAEDNAGRIYITINPNQVKLDDSYAFSFVTSDGATTSAATIGEFVPSNEKLTFGWTRSAAEVGFYEAPVKIDATKYAEIAPKFAVSKTDLKDIAKGMLSNETGIDLFGVAKAVLTLAKTELDANALKVEWSDSLGKHSVTSEYDVAVTAFKPLSYNAMSDLSEISTSFRIPTINPLSELSISVPDFAGIDLSDITFTIDKTTASISFDNIIISKTGVVQVVVEKPTAYNNVTNTFTFSKETINVDGLVGILTDVENALNTSKITWQANANDAIQNIIDQVNNKVNDLIKNQIGGKMNTAINDMLDQVENSINGSLGSYNTYIGEMNNLVSKVNNLANKFNPWLSKDASIFLAPWIMYEGTDGGFHPMSNDPNNPTVFKKGQGGIVLYTTSFSAELFAPSYKKYVAVTKFKKPNGSIDQTKKIAQNFNQKNKEYYNKVLEGERYAIPFDPTEAGTYTIYYSAMDYSGYVAAERFYVTVEE